MMFDWASLGQASEQSLELLFHGFRLSDEFQLKNKNDGFELLGLFEDFLLVLHNILWLLSRNYFVGAFYADPKKNTVNWCWIQVTSVLL